MKKLLLLLFLLCPTVKADELSVPQWTVNMDFFGQKNCDYLKGTASFDSKLNAVYYDGMKVYFQIADYTGDKIKWVACADAARKVYRDDYVLKNNGAVPGYQVFTKGLRWDWERRSATESKRAVTLLATNAAWAADSAYNNTNMPSAEYSRETAYIGNAYIDSWKVGNTLNLRVHKLLQFALGHYDQWFVSHSAPYVRPFMAALTAEFLIQYYEEISADPRILPALKTGASWLWDNCWVESAKAFKYTDRVVDSGGTEPAPDLNQLVSPLYSWLYKQTGETVWRDRAVSIFNGGVAGAYLSQGKIFNQNYRTSFRVLSDLAGAPNPTPTRTGTPTGSPTRTVTATPTRTPTISPTPIIILLDGPSKITIERR